MAKKIVVVGGGLSGLSLSFFLKKILPRSVEITILEQSKNHLGGWIKTTNNKNANYLFELGPRGFRPSRNGSEVLQLVERLGLQSEILVASKAAQKKRLLYLSGEISSIPTSFKELLSWPLVWPVAKAIALEPFQKPSLKSDESIYDFIVRRFNKVVAEKLIDPMVSGIFGGDIRQLSIAACFPILKQAEEEHGSIVKAMLFAKKKTMLLLDGSEKTPFILAHENSVSISFRNGMETLTSKLYEELVKQPNVTIQKNSALESIEVSIDNRLKIKTTSHADIMQADYVFSTIPAHELAKVSFLNKSETDLKSKLNRISNVDMAIVLLGYKSNGFLKEKGFGYLVPSSENQQILGVVYDSISFPSQNRQKEETRLSVMMGGANQKWISEKSKAELEEIALQTISRHFGHYEKPDFIDSVVLKKCIPQYSVGHRENVTAIEGEISKLTNHKMTVLGNSFHGIGLADCVSTAHEKALTFYKENEEFSTTN